MSGGRVNNSSSAGTQGGLWSNVRQWFGAEPRSGGGHSGASGGRRRKQREGAGSRNRRPRSDQGGKANGPAAEPLLFDRERPRLAEREGTGERALVKPRSRSGVTPFPSVARTRVASPVDALGLLAEVPPAPGFRTRAEVYEHLASELPRRYQIVVRRWRSSTTGVAILRKDPHGRWLVREIETPYPRGVISCAVFLHEIGHHAIGVGSLKPRCLEEWAAWDWSLRELRRHHVPITDRLRDRVHDALFYAVWKARRRGLRVLPAELAPFAQPRPGFGRKRAAG